MLQGRHPSMEVFGAESSVKKMCPENSRDVLGAVLMVCLNFSMPAVEVAKSRPLSEIPQFAERPVVSLDIVERLLEASAEIRSADAWISTEFLL